MSTGQLSCSESFEGSYFMSSTVMEATTNQVSKNSTDLSLFFTLGSEVPH